MGLKNIVIIGFKSFAEKTVLKFNKGITCIVGPNGCGKSNIADAFRWVLGEQSAKSMRGNKMEHVIFAGTNQRKPLNLAEVSLTLTNQGELLIPYEEVTVTRKLYRSGESDYFLNGQQVRLKDVQSLFFDSGVGCHAFSIFEQGEMDKIISYSPLERRAIFEEAAGITRFLQRKKEALKRLEQSDLNFSRVKDIYGEVERQISTLRQQADKAKAYKEAQQLLEKLEILSYALRWRQFEQKRKSYEEKQRQYQSELDLLQEKVGEIQGKYQEVKTLLQQKEKAFKEQQEGLFKIREDKNLHLHQQTSLKKEREEILQREKKLKQEASEVSLSRKKSREKAQEFQKNLKEIEKSFQEAELQLKNDKDGMKGKEKEVENIRSEINVFQQKRLSLFQQESQLGKECKQGEIRLEHQLERRKGLEEKRQCISQDLLQYDQQIQDKRKTLNQLSKLIDSYKERLVQFEENLKVSQQEIENKQQNIEELKREALEEKARYQLLMKMRENHEGFSLGSKRLLQESVQKSSPFFEKIKPLYSYFHADEEVSNALGLVLKSYTHTLVVEKEEDFKKVIEYSRNHELHDFSLFCLEWVNAQKSKKKSSLAKKIEAHRIVEYFLTEVEEVKDWQAGFEQLKVEFEGSIWCHQEGVFFDRKKVYFDAKAGDIQPFLRESELKHLEMSLKEKEQKLKEMDIELRQLLQKKQQWQQERFEIDKTLRKDEMKLVEVNFGLQKAVADLDKTKQDQEKIDKEIIHVTQELEQQQVHLKKGESQYTIVKQDLQSLNHTIERMERELETQQKAFSSKQKGFFEKNRNYQRLMEDKRHLQHQLSLCDMKEQEHEKEEMRIKLEYAELEKKEKEAKEKEKEVDSRLQELHEQLKKVETHFTSSEKEIEETKQLSDQLEKEMIQKQNQLKKKESEKEQMHLQETHHRSNAESLEKELQDKFGIQINDALKLKENFSDNLEKVEKQIHQLRQSLQSMGEVNMMAIEELENHQTRYKFLTQQMQDLKEARTELLQIISQLDQESKKKFKETFDLVNANFKKNFQILFGGGEVDLQFTENNDLLEAGIEIIVKPPGKQMRSITLLSGGEKCLTAMALLFSIFEVKPSPFCILDEIDAPLDDSNVDRFAQMLQHFADRCQFLIITHNKKTMAIADVIFGVSMEEKGVSKLLSMEFSHCENPEVALV